MRNDGRLADEFRKTTIETHYLVHNKASVLITMGNTKIIVAASVEERVPHFLFDKNQGWLTAQYSMLPSSTKKRVSRDRYKVAGRTKEIQRLIGRSLRAVTDLEKLGQRTITLDCDVIQADGGTRTASITAGYVALDILCQELIKEGKINKNPVKSYCTAISVGIYQSKALLDLSYYEDSRADVDMNIVMSDAKDFIELQATAEKNSFTNKQLQQMMSLAHQGIGGLVQLQKSALEKKYEKNNTSNKK